jgi:hypothetical protein
MIKTFRGLIVDGGQDTIVLHTQDGSTGYKIVKFQIMSKAPFTNNDEHVLKVYKVNQTSIDGVVDLSDTTLIGVAIINNSSSGFSYPSVSTIIFDHEIVNQDIYVTHASDAGSDPCNYYIELEQVKLDLNENTVATLKNLRNIPH